MISWSLARTKTRESLLAWFPKNNLSVGECLLSRFTLEARIRTRIVPASGRPSPTSKIYRLLGGITTTPVEIGGTSGLILIGFHAYFAPP